MMGLFTKRTDLAVEGRDIYLHGSGREPDGIEVHEYQDKCLDVAHIEILNAQGAKAIGKPIGTYITATLREDWLRFSEWVAQAAETIAGLIVPLLPREGSVLIAGLGNRGITPDNLGPTAIENIVVTRHLIESMPSELEGMRSVCAISTGVLGLTGIETAEIIHGVVDRVKPTAVVAIDALAAYDSDRLCRTFQISNTGISPGSGAYNARNVLDQESMGVPVIAIGVPTVIESMTLIAGYLEKHGIDVDTKFFQGNSRMLVTPKDIDILIKKSAKVIGYALNIALQGSMTVAEMEQFLG